MTLCSCFLSLALGSALEQAIDLIALQGPCSAMCCDRVPCQFSWIQGLTSGSSADLRFSPTPPHSPVFPAFAEQTFQLLSGGLHFSVLTTTDHPHSCFCFLKISTFISCFFSILTLSLLSPGFRFQDHRLLCESLSSCVLIYKVGITSPSAPLGGAEDEVRKCV